jgi:hypothetical protein
MTGIAVAEAIVSNGVCPTRSKATWLERFVVAEDLFAPANAFSRRLNQFNAPFTQAGASWLIAI